MLLPLFFDNSGYSETPLIVNLLAGLLELRVHCITSLQIVAGVQAQGGLVIGKHKKREKNHLPENDKQRNLCINDMLGPRFIQRCSLFRG